MAVSEWGDAGPCVVALHPGVGDRRTWHACAPEWAEAGFRVVAYDRRGFGDTEYVPEAHDDLDDLRAVTAATDARPAVVVGNSRGGGLALDLALDFPEDVSGLILIAPSPSGYDYDDWPTVAAEAEQDELMVAAEASEDLTLVNSLEARYWLDGVEQPDGRVGGAARELFLDMNGRALRAYPVGESAERRPSWDRLTEIACPVLVLVGEYDLPGIQQQCAQVADLVPDATLATIDGTAHVPALDEPAALNTHVVGFLRSIS